MSLIDVGSSSITRPSGGGSYVGSIHGSYVVYTSISKWNGITISSISKLKGVTFSTIGKINGVS